MSRFPRRMLSNTYTAPTANAAVGLYSMSEQLQAKQSSSWPLLNVPAFRASSAWNTSGYQNAGTPVPVTMPTGTQVGDLVVIFDGFSGFTNAADTTNKTGWTSTVYLINDLYGYYGTILYKVVTADDLTGMTITPSNSGGNTYGVYLAMSFISCNNISVQLNAPVGATSELSFNLPGITKSGFTKFVVSVPVDRTGAANWTATPAWIQMAQIKDVSGSIFNITGSYLAAANYTSNATIPWTRSTSAYAAGSWTVDIQG